MLLRILTKPSRILIRMPFAVLLGLFTTAANANPVECRQGEVTRTIEIVYANPGAAVPCEVIYSKPAQGTIEMLWQAMNESGYCETRVSELTSKLETLGWQCSKTTDSDQD